MPLTWIDESLATNSCIYFLCSSVNFFFPLFLPRLNKLSGSSSYFFSQRCATLESIFNCFAAALELSNFSSFSLKNLMISSSVLKTMTILINYITQSLRTVFIYGAIGLKYLCIMVFFKRYQLLQK
ncbi:hypothetical protein PHYBLDRAFT_70069 [Phycomyces blakesleeanus NRRL 1555(-)]|uniref:Uncharacterized protein n=1 Tax=Phycomyces blakesleeanus (strain ATCC 8743b / DSM 1359 / FGSC 10004 / NBRC 33097 / NRRL 1555) TaxID=763407 RepID=A0A162TWS1_PHYB8|nr:hypothetical protein PHYBLDRAFT_70069 [Phycomyces blakesleeanus NRRL 1555(-)]OAD71592.1 hypothetical protein PHYBLDRAFT_70069 [Phycomyces blakesleeanus NRRL 1555(-)]|eukprot:XP_018289632.1 hypothetical protein PHYBLDRAFT_70069 [Phycomyces blakesleeanus NRRL 1555(-)]